MNQRMERTIATSAQPQTGSRTNGSATDLVGLIESSLDDDKAEDVIVIDLAGKSTMADAMVVATGRSARQVGAMAEHLREKLKKAGHPATAEGMPQCDWVLLDAGQVLVHLFRPEVRAFYGLEKMWGEHQSAQQAEAASGA